jgi:membrane protease YdiL (CAAX protease family)
VKLLSQNPRTPGVRWIFFGAKGVRPGWRFLLFALGIELGIWIVETPLARLLSLATGVDLFQLSAPAMLIRKFVLCVSVFLVTGVAAKLEGQRIDSYGLPFEQAFGRFFWKGMLAGSLLILFLGGTMFLTGATAVQGFAIHDGRAVKAALLWFAANVLLGLSEEYTFRGYALQTLWRGWGFWPASLLTSFVFAADHLEKAGENAIDISLLFFLSLILCLSVRRTGSLWWAVGWHAAFDLGQLFIIGSPNGGFIPVDHLLDVTFPGSAWLTGGTLGTEASVLMIPGALLTLAWVVSMLEKKQLTGDPKRAR